MPPSSPCPAPSSDSGATRDLVDVELDPDRAPPPIVIATTDPAQPYGAALGWPATPGRPSRSANALTVLRQGVPLVWFDRRSHHLVTFAGAESDGSWAAALAGLVDAGRERSVEVRKVDGGAVTEEIADVLRSAGFIDGYRGLVIRS